MLGDEEALTADMYKQIMNANAAKGRIVAALQLQIIKNGSSNFRRSTDLLAAHGRLADCAGFTRPAKRA